MYYILKRKGLATSFTLDFKNAVEMTQRKTWQKFYPPGYIKNGDIATFSKERRCPRRSRIYDVAIAFGD